MGAVAPGELADCTVQLWGVLAGGWRKQKTEIYPKPEVTGAEREAQPSAGNVSGARHVFSAQNLRSDGKRGEGSLRSYHSSGQSESAEHRMSQSSGPPVM